MLFGYSTSPFDDSDIEMDYLSAEGVLNGLLQHNLFPNHSKEKEELPPIFTSASFTTDVAKQLAESTGHRSGEYPGYDTVEYKLTRYNGVARNCSIPHPRAYATLAHSIFDNWEHLRYIMDNEVSLTRPKPHDDGRIAVMNYENKVDEKRRELMASFGRRFRVTTDITNFYPSIYSHSISWATVGVATAKANRDPKAWFNKLDKAVRDSKRGETIGIAIGPGTSSILSELILARVDCELTDTFADKLSHTRYIDDYTAYCDSYNIAEEYIIRLSEELDKYKLKLNVTKTEIVSLPEPNDDNWVVRLNNAFSNVEMHSPYSIGSFLDLAVSIANPTPDGSILKYALKSIVKGIEQVKEQNQVDVDISDTLMQYAFNLAFYQPVLAPLLGRLIDAGSSFDSEEWASSLQRILCEYTRRRNSDGISWILYYCLIYKISIRECCANTIIESEDCIPILLLYLAGDINQQAEVRKFANRLVGEDLYHLDRYWLLFYQLFLEGIIANPYNNDMSFEILKAGGVTFLESTASSDLPF